MSGLPDPHVGEGSTVGRYQLRRELGRGGMGVVHAAWDPALAREVALKLLHHHGLDGDAAAEARLHREARAMARLSHPNVVPVFEVGEHDDRLFIAMELIHGEALDAWWQRTARPWREVTAVALQAGRGLAAAHDRGIVHRDFKPGNVLVGEDRRVRVLDFGLALPVPVVSESAGPVTARGRAAFEDSLSDARLTQSGFVLGTPAYLAPEVLDGAEPDPRSDQFAFCVALYEGLYGELPFAGKSVIALADEVLAGNVRPPPERSRVPTWLRALVLRGLSPRPEDRHPTVRSLLASIVFSARIMSP